MNCNTRICRQQVSDTDCVYLFPSKSTWFGIFIMRILLAEDDSVLADGLTRSLRQSGYATDCVSNGQEADSALSTQDFDLLILDLGLPKMSGLEVLRRLRARNSHLPVLILTAADSVEQRVKGLDLGADDYMAKPFALSELEARVRALTRRGAGGGPTVIKHGPLSYDQVGRIAYIHEQMLDLSARELGLLEVLLQRTGRWSRKNNWSITFVSGARKSAITRSKCMCIVCVKKSKSMASELRQSED
jgi:DNA-binding response OmpR family regulator